MAIRNTRRTSALQACTVGLIMILSIICCTHIASSEEVCSDADWSSINKKLKTLEVMADSSLPQFSASQAEIYAAIGDLYLDGDDGRAVEVLGKYDVWTTTHPIDGSLSYDEFVSHISGSYSGCARRFDDAGKRAFNAYTRAAALGNGTGYMGLARLYENGVGVPKDMSMAVSLSRIAAEMGLPEAQYQLATFYVSMPTLVKDAKLLAYMWYNISGIEIEGSKSSVTYLERSMSAEEIQRAQRMSTSCLKQNFRNCERRSFFWELFK